MYKNQAERETCSRSQHCHPSQGSRKGLFHPRATSWQQPSPPHHNQPSWQQEENQHLVPCEERLKRAEKLTFLGEAEKKLRSYLPLQEGSQNSAVTA